MPFGSKRKIILINKDLQFKVAAIYAFVLVIGIILSGGLFYTLLLRRGQATDENWEIFVRPLLYTNILTSVVVILLAVCMTAFISHRIAGPLYRFTKLLEQIGSGDFNVNTRLRKKDELVPFANSVADMASQLKSRINEVKQSLVEVETAVGSAPSPELRQALTKLKNHVESFRS